MTYLDTPGAAVRLVATIAVVTHRLWQGVITGAGFCFLAMIACWGGGEVDARAQQPAGPSDKQLSRYLLVVDISKSMLPRAPGSLAAIGELLATGLDGRIRDGDDLAVWTFSEELYAGRFPIQRWTAAEQGNISAHVLGHLRDQTIGKVANIEKLMTAVDYVVKDSDNITVVIITDGEQKFHGTPFDNQINDFLTRQEKKQKKAKMPFVIAVRAASGVMKDFAVSVPPQPIRIPAAPVPAPLPAPAPQPIPVAAAPAAVSAPIAQPVVVAPSPKTNLVAGAMIFSGSDPKPIVIPTTNAPDGTTDAAKLAADAAEARKAARTLATQSTLLLAPAQRADFVALGAAIEAPTVSMGGASPKPKKAGSTNAAAKAEAALAAASPAPATAAVPPVPASASTAQISATNLASPSPAAVKPVAAQPLPAAVSKPNVVVAQIAPPKPVENRGTNLAPAPQGPAGATSSKVPAAAAPMTATTAASPEVVRAKELHPMGSQSPEPAAAQVGVVTPGTGFVNGWLFWTAALGLVGIACYCAFLVLHRSLPGSSPSLITCSIDRNKKGCIGEGSSRQRPRSR
jgi:hypothetical protein